MSDITRQLALEAERVLLDAAIAYLNANEGYLSDDIDDYPRGWTPTLATKARRGMTVLAEWHGCTLADVRAHVAATR